MGRGMSKRGRVMPSLIIDLTGRRVGHWTVLAIHQERRRRRNKPYILWRCRCDCGVERLVLGGNLHSGQSTSCGCVRREKLAQWSTKHGLRWTRTYAIWCAMLQRCFNPADKRYRDYGGRGIKVCADWRTFNNFYADMGEAPPGLSLDRINNNAGYKPQNCRWATPVVQSRNRRRRYRLKKKTMCVVPAAAHYEEPPF
jgi:hypothetical protein